MKQSDFEWGKGQGHGNPPPWKFNEYVAKIKA